MFIHALPQLNALKLVLASGSPRRRELLSSLGLVFECVPSTFPEKLEKAAPEEYCVETAKGKALEVAERLGKGGHVVIGADTVVVSPAGIQYTTI